MVGYDNGGTNSPEKSQVLGLALIAILGETMILLPLI
jgi:hypothetical protein